MARAVLTACSSSGFNRSSTSVAISPKRPATGATTDAMSAGTATRASDSAAVEAARIECRTAQRTRAADQRADVRRLCPSRSGPASAMACCSAPTRAGELLIERPPVSTVTVRRSITVGTRHSPNKSVMALVTLPSWSSAVVTWSSVPREQRRPDPRVRQFASASSASSASRHTVDEPRRLVEQARVDAAQRIGWRRRWRALAQREVIEDFVGRSARCSKRMESITTNWMSVASVMSATKVTGSPRAELLADGRQELRCAPRRRTGCRRSRRAWARH